MSARDRIIINKRGTVVKNITIILIFVSPLLLVTGVQAGINDGLIAYYPFDGDTNDYSGNGNDGKVQNCVTIFINKNPLALSK